MLTFFRKIRRGLLPTSQARRYGLYALGEIVLVVVGILIALQINNWNQERSAREYQNKMLIEIRSGLLQDRDYIGHHLPNNRIGILRESLDFFERLLLMGIDNQDSINHHFGRLYNTYGVTLNRGPYEALKFTGLDKVTNDSLRNHLIYIYDFVYPRHERFLLHSEDVVRDKRQQLMEQLTADYVLEIENDQVRYPWPGMKGIDFHTNQTFLELLDLTETRITRGEDIVLDFLPYINGLIGHIDAELK